MALEFSYKYKWNGSSYGWLQKIESDLQFSGKNIRKEEILKKRRGNWEEWLNILESFCIKMSDLRWIPTLFQILSKSVYKSYCQSQKNWTICTRLFHFLLTSSMDQTVSTDLPIWIIVPDKHMAAMQSVCQYQQANEHVKLESFANKMGRDWNE